MVHGSYVAERRALPTEYTKDKIQDKERSHDDERDIVDPAEPYTHVTHRRVSLQDTNTHVTHRRDSLQDTNTHVTHSSTR